MKKDEVPEVPEEILSKITALCAELGWLVAMDDNKDTVSGVIIGTPDYIFNTVDQLTDPSTYTVYEHGPQDDLELH